MYRSLNGAPFMLQSIYFRERLFSSELKSCQVNPFLYKDAVGFAIGDNSNKVIKAAIGEHLERLAVVKHFKKSNVSGNFPAFNVLTGQIIKVPPENILMNFDLPVFKNMDNTEFLFSDTCGLAAHTNTISAIVNAFFEFIERQSLIFTWLTKSSGEKIDKIFLQELNVQTKIQNLKESLEKFELINISILKDVYVIMAICYNDRNFAIGLKSDTSLDKAIIGSINEMQMVLNSNTISQYSLRRDDIEVKVDNFYAKFFYNMDVIEFKNQYQFLFETAKTLKDVKNITPGIGIKDLHYLTKKFVEQFEIDIYVTFINTPINNNNVKVVKVFSPDAYPHMNTEILEPLHYKISNKLLQNKEIPNKYKRIPIT